MLLNLISSIIVFIVSMAINFFLTPFILKSLGNEAFGFVGLSNAIVAYAAVVTTAINSVSGRFVAYEWHGGRIESANGYYSSVLAVNLFFCAVYIKFRPCFKRPAKPKIRRYAYVYFLLYKLLRRAIYGRSYRLRIRAKQALSSIG